MLGRRRQKHQAKKLLFRRLKMNLIIISQDKNQYGTFHNVVYLYQTTVYMRYLYDLIMRLMVYQ